MKNIKFTEINKSFAVIEKLKDEIAKQRDLLRTYVEDLGDILESLEEADEGVGDGLRQIKDAIAVMSGYL